MESPFFRFVARNQSTGEIHLIVVSEGKVRITTIFGIDFLFIMNVCRLYNVVPIHFAGVDMTHYIKWKKTFQPFT